MSMGRSITPREELSAGMVAADTECSICRAKAETSCDCCDHEICQECTVKCARCADDNEYCLCCAVRNGYTEVEGKHYCENCMPEEIMPPSIPIHEEEMETV